MKNTVSCMKETWVKQNAGNFIECEEGAEIIYGHTAQTSEELEKE